ncbi:glycosyltransferase family 2 protein [Aeromonas caviae]|uniref:glycosyltransferase family 2 protein n=1 Tax=Aeromonas caviae TaxID=648 RepID=UPI0038CF43E2
MFHLTEAEIIANWPVDEPIRVSVCCITYKQEQYIAQAIDSFLMQKTTFPFEIVIGEDCGGDGTMSILYEYQKRYPNLIKIITSEQNIGANANLLRVFTAARGDYIAICEGDDYWISEQKLTKQKEILDIYSDIDLVTSNAICVDKNCIYIKDFYCGHSFFSTLKDVLLSPWQFAPTASYFFRKRSLEKIPLWFANATIGDIYMELYLGESGIIVCDEPLCAYRIGAENSWSSTINKSKLNSIVSHYDNFIYSLEIAKKDLCGFDYFFDFKINDIRLSKAKTYLKVSRYKDAYIEMSNVNFFNEMSVKNKFVYYIFRLIYMFVPKNEN